MSLIKLDNASVAFPIYESTSKNRRHSIRNLFGVRRKKRDFFALNDLTCSFNTGDRVALIGKNGSGKTTLLKVLAGVLPLTHGSLTVRGQVFAALNVSSGFFGGATCWQNLVMLGLSYGLSGNKLKDYVDEVATRANINKFLHSPLNSLSTGMRSRLVVASLSVEGLEILLMDEWIGTVDRTITEEHDSPLHRLVETSKVFVLASHRDNVVRNLCNKAILLDKGRLLQAGDVDEVLAHHRKRPEQK